MLLKPKAPPINSGGLLHVSSERPEHNSPQYTRTKARREFIFQRWPGRELCHADYRPAWSPGSSSESRRIVKAWKVGAAETLFPSPPVPLPGTSPSFAALLSHAGLPSGCASGSQGSSKERAEAAQRRGITGVIPALTQTPLQAATVLCLHG